MLCRYGYGGCRVLVLGNLHWVDFKLWPKQKLRVFTNAGRRVVGFGVGEDGGEFGSEEFGDVVSGAEHGRADCH